MWKRLEQTDLQKILSDDEVDKLMDVSTTFPNVVQDVLDVVSDSWRGAFLARGYEVDVRDHYTPPEYAYWILVHARYAIWTRFPNSPAYALDEARKNEYEKALDLLSNPHLATSKPDYSDDPSIKPTPRIDSAIGVGFQRFGSTHYYSGNSIKEIW